MWRNLRAGTHSRNTVDNDAVGRGESRSNDSQAAAKVANLDLSGRGYVVFSHDVHHVVGLILEHGGMFDIADWVRAHHERFDGQGYPERLSGPAIYGTTSSGAG